MISKEDFITPLSVSANRLIDYYDGRQLSYVIKALNGDLDGGLGYRYDWRRRGYVPVVRNITAPIAEKSAGSLFDKQPTLEILPSTSPTAEPVIDARLNEILMVSDFEDFTQNWNVLSRLLRSVCILLQKQVEGERETIGGIYRFDADAGDGLLPVLLHAGNSVVRMNALRTIVTEVAFLTNGTPGDAHWEYRYINSEVIEDRMVHNDAEVVVSRVPNPDGIVPAFMHYDTKKPRTGVWAPIPEDLRTMQELVNTHLTDLAFALASQKSQPLYTTARIKKPNESDEEYGVVGTIDSSIDTKLLNYKKEQPSIGGIGSIVYLESGKGGETPLIEHKGPSVDLASQQQIISDLIKDVASDWSVRIKVAGDGRVSSGFQLIVEEMDNLNLRQQRSHSFKASMRKFYAIMKRLYPELTDGELQVVFTPPSLPVNQREVEEIWGMKIAGNRASTVDYLMQVEGLTREEAIMRLQQIYTENSITTPRTPEPPVSAGTETEVETGVEGNSETGVLEKE